MRFARQDPNLNSGLNGVGAFTQVSGEKIVAGGVTGAVIATAGVVSGGNPLVIGSTAASLSITRDTYFGESPSVGGVLLEGGVTAATVGVLKSAPKVTGPQANFSTQSSAVNSTFFAGAHAQRIYIEEAIGSAAQATAEAVRSFLGNVGSILGGQD